MGKQYFKYGSGYVNIDSENLYLTNSGNWQEASELKEKSPKSQKQNNSRIAGNNFFMFMLYTIVVFYIIFSKEHKFLKFIGGLIVLAVFVHKYFKPEMGKRYKIPLSKIESIKYSEKRITIHFRNEANEADKESIDNVDPKGIEILQDLKLLSLPNIEINR